MKSQYFEDVKLEIVHRKTKEMYVLFSFVIIDNIKTMIIHVNYDYIYRELLLYYNHTKINV